MEKIPIELHREIYRLACIDDGSTGRALSTVCHYVREASADFRYQSVALHNSQQVARFYDLVQSHLQDHSLEVRHLFVCIETPKNFLREHIIAESKRGKSSEEQTLVPLLKALAGRLVTFSLVVPEIYSGFASSLLFDRDGSTPSFPRLLELTLCGRLYLPPSPTFAPQLKRLHLMDSGSIEWFPGFFLKHRLPNLTHLRISGSGESEFQQALFAPEIAPGIMSLTCLMGLLPGEQALQAAKRYGLSLSTLTKQYPGKVLVVEAAEPVISTFMNMMHEAPELFEKVSGRFVLQGYRPYLLPYEVNPRIKSEWLERLQGKPGCWPAGEAV